MAEICWFFSASTASGNVSAAAAAAAACHFVRGPVVVPWWCHILHPHSLFPHTALPHSLNRLYHLRCNFDEL
uniref:Putative secreted protein n=1 Tax=Anopheles marajoara TaxID=58244 RepID=A0A2M4CE40_9DIPT